MNKTKKIALFLASVMALSCVPSFNTQASSNNSLSYGVMPVSEKTMFYEPGSGTLPAGAVNANYLEIELKEDVGSVTTEEGATGEDAAYGFSLNLTNSVFNFDSTAQNYNTKYGHWDGTTYTRGGTGTSLPNGEVAYKMVIGSTKDYADVVLYHGTKGDFIKIPLVAKVKDNVTEGNCMVAIVPDSGYPSTASSGVLTFAVIGKAHTYTEVPDKQTGKREIPVNELVIQERSIGSIKNDSEGFYLELINSGYKFSNQTPTVELRYLTADTVESPTLGYGVAVGGKARYGYSANGKKLEIRFEGLKNNNSGQARITLSGLKILASNDVTSKQDVMMRIDNLSGSAAEMVTAEEFIAGYHANYSVSMETSGDIPSLVNGYFEGVDELNDHNRSAKIIVEEDTYGSLINGRDLELKVSGNAKIVGVKIEDVENISGTTISGTYYAGTASNGVEVKESKVILSGIQNSTTSSTAKFTISFYLSIESGFEGDITVALEGDAISSNASLEPVVIAKAINPVIASVNYNYLVPGKTFSLADIKITEQMDSKGFSPLQEGKKVRIGFKNNNGYLHFVSTPVASTEGDLKIKSASLEDDSTVFSFYIDAASTKGKPSSILLSGLKVAANTNIPSGNYPLVIAGTAIAQNSNKITTSDSESKFTFTTDGLGIAKLELDGSLALKITIGDRIAVVNGQNVEMQVAPFIDSKTGTTYVQASDIVKLTGKTCTFLDTRVQEVEGLSKNLFVTFGDRTFEKDKAIVKIDSKTIPETMTNELGLPVPMIIKEDRTCLPIRYFIESVLGQSVVWNGTDNTITVNE